MKSTKYKEMIRICSDGSRTSAMHESPNQIFSARLFFFPHLHIVHRSDQTKSKNKVEWA